MQHDSHGTKSLQLYMASLIENGPPAGTIMSSGGGVQHLPGLNSTNDTKDALGSKPSRKADTQSENDEADEKKKAEKRARRKAKRKKQDADDDGSDDPNDDDDDDDEDDMRAGVTGRARKRERARCAAILTSARELGCWELGKQLALTTSLPRAQAISMLMLAGPGSQRGTLAARMAQANIPLVPADEGGRHVDAADRALALAEQARPGMIRKP